MKIEINPQDTSRAEAFMLWMSSPMPMVTLTKTFDVTNLLKTSKKRGVKFNALLCWCIGKAASRIDEFYLLVARFVVFEFTFYVHRFPGRAMVAAEIGVALGQSGREPPPVGQLDTTDVCPEQPHIRICSLDDLIKQLTFTARCFRCFRHLIPPSVPGCSRRL